ncbi:hypothetical protein Aoki45_37040 [Algoriphagus sp. oki45]|nr:hypothetical protein Aoki45_37040 [Algoriphagus sp. oki45]
MIKKDSRITLMNKRLPLRKIKQSRESQKSRFRHHKLAHGREISGLAAYE